VLAYDVPGTDRGNDLKFTKETSAFDSDARAGLDYLTGRPRCTGRLGVMGICLSGHLAFRAALNPDVLATACGASARICRGGAPGPLPCGRAHLFAVDRDIRITSVKPTRKWCTVDEEFVPELPAGASRIRTPGPTCAGIAVKRRNRPGH
jgi:hypothetical protein